MKKSRLIMMIAVVVAVIAAFSLLISCSQKGTELSYKFTTGKTTNYDANMSMNMKMHVDNAPPQLASMLADKKIDMNVTMGMEQKVEEVKDDVAKLMVVHKPREAKMTMDGKDLPIPADSNKETKFTMDIKKTGEITDIKAEGSEDPVSDSKQTKMMLETKLPGKMTNVGFEWNEEIDTEMQVGNGNMNLKGTIKYKFTKMEDYQGVNCAVITYAGDLKPEISSEAAETAKMEGTGHLSGTIHFDPVAGEIAKNEKNMKLNLQMEIPTPPIPGQAEGAKPKVTTDADMKYTIERVKQ